VPLEGIASIPVGSTIDARVADRGAGRTVTVRAGHADRARALLFAAKRRRAAQ
jgi:hypothetical protein